MACHFPALVVGERLRGASGIRLSAALKPSTAEVAVASCIFTNIKSPVLRSTSVPTADALPLPLMRSPSQWPGVKRSSASSGRTWMLTRSEIWPWRSTPPERGRRLVLPCRRQDDQLLARLAHRQRVDGAVDRFATDVHVFKLWESYTSEFAGNLLRRKALSQQVDYKVEQVRARLKLASRSADRTALAYRLVGLAGRIGRLGRGVTMKLSADGRGN